MFSPLQIAQMVDLLQSLPLQLNNIAQRMADVEALVVNENEDLDPLGRRPMDNTILPPGVAGRRRASVDPVDPQILPEPILPNLDVEQVPINTVIRALEKVSPDLMVRSLSLSGVQLGIKNQGIHQRSTRQTVRLVFFFEHTANMQMKHYVDAHPEHPSHGSMTESKLYELNDDQFLRLAAMTIRAKNRTSTQISSLLVRSIPDLEIDSAYTSGFTNYHECVFAKISKLITDMEWRTNFIYLGATNEEIKLWPAIKLGKKDKPGFLYMLMLVLDQSKRNKFQEMFTQRITEDKLKEFDNFADFYSALRSANMHFHEKGRTLADDTEALMKPKSLDQMREILFKSTPPGMLNRGIPSGFPRDGNLRDGNPRVGNPRVGYSTPGKSSGGKKFIPYRKRAPQSVRLILGEGDETVEETFISAIQQEYTTEAEELIAGLAYDSDEQDVAYEVDDFEMMENYANVLQSSGFKKTNNFNGPPKKIYGPGTPLRKPGSAPLPCFVEFDKGPGQCPDSKCPYSHSEKDMIAFRDTQIKRLLKSPFSLGVEQLVEAIRSVHKTSSSYGNNKSILDDSNVSEEREVAVHPFSKTDS